MTDIKALPELLLAFERQDQPRVIVRWTDETRPIGNETGGYTVGNVCRIVLTGKIEGDVQQLTFEGLTREEFRRLSAGSRIVFIERSDNIGK